MKRKIFFLVLSIGLLSLASCDQIEEKCGNIFPSYNTSTSAHPIETAIPTISPTPTALPTIKLTPTSTIPPTPQGGSVALLIDTGPVGGRSWIAHGLDSIIYLKNIATNYETRIGRENTRLEDISYDQKSLLLSEGNLLFLTDIYGNDPVLISSDYLDHRHDDGIWIEITAHWLKSGDIVFLSKKGFQNIINITSMDDLNNPRSVYSTTNTIELFQTHGYGILWEEKSKIGGRYYAEGFRWIALDTDDVTTLGNINNPEVSPDGTFLIYADFDGRGQRQLILLNILLMEYTGITLPNISDFHTSVDKLIWGPEGEFLLVIRSVCDLSCETYYTQMIDLDGNEVMYFPDIISPMDSIAWSPDGHYLMIRGDHILNMENFELQELKYGEYSRRFFWLPSGMYQEIYGANIPAVSIEPICERTNPLCFSYYFIEKSIFNGPGNFTYEEEYFADDGGVKSVVLRNWLTGESLKKYIFMFNPGLSTYTAALPIDGEVVNFHGQAQLIPDIEDEWWQIHLDDNVPQGVSRTIYIDPDFKELSWQLPTGHISFAVTFKWYDLY